MRILVCTDGSRAAEDAASLCAQLSFPPDTEILLLGVSESDGDQGELTSSLARMEKVIGGPRPRITQKIRYGQPAEQILEESRENAYNLIVIQSIAHQHGLMLFKIGSTANKLARELDAPLLVARAVPKSLQRVLICTAAESPSLEMIRIGGSLISHTQAEVVLLHVMSQVALRLDSPPADLHATAKSAIERESREGQHLKRGMELLRQIGARGPIRPHLRHGLVVDQVLAEIDAGSYDLLVIGAHYHLRKDRWLQILLEDISGQLILQSPCSVLVV